MMVELGPGTFRGAGVDLNSSVKGLIATVRPSVGTGEREARKQMSARALDQGVVP